MTVYLWHKGPALATISYRCLYNLDMETEKVKNLLVFVADRTQPVVGREDVILPAALTHPH